MIEPSSIHIPISSTVSFSSSPQFSTELTEGFLQISAQSIVSLLLSLKLAGLNIVRGVNTDFGSLLIPFFES
jgi:hypothetical protein